MIHLLQPPDKGNNDKEIKAPLPFRFFSIRIFPREHYHWKLGWESVSGDNHLSTLLRGEVLTALATFGHDKTHKEAMRRFYLFLGDRNTTLLPADMRKAAYVAVMRNTSTMNRNGFESLLNVYREADAVQEKTRVLGSMASCPDPDIVLEVLNFFLSDEVRDQDIVYGLLGISLEGRETAWRWLKENWDIIFHKWGSGILLTHFIRDIVALFCSNEKADEVEEFFASRDTTSIAMTLKHALEQIRNKARWVENIKREESIEGLIKALACRE
ncbi:hypothetical protein HHK36_021829 [Tetracentron sinense]|uniref:ERAP1-like C-terminal domain-containing protein n=1 Tax=Tetracentron sinense TaxID=13715 RepID=A0A834YUC6_TETSI|nr:hypothetical protein HHK36_021829 [Tetracentron sinense]